MTQMGRKRMKLDDPKIHRLINALRLGHYVEDACEYAPISRPTFYRWINEGEELDIRHDAGETLTPQEQEIRDICNTIKAAQIQGQNVALDIVRASMTQGDWRAAAWFMERRNKRWSNRTEVTGKDGGPIESVSLDDLDAKLMGLVAAAKRSEVENEITLRVEGSP